MRIGSRGAVWIAAALAGFGIGLAILDRADEGSARGSIRAPSAAAPEHAAFEPPTRAPRSLARISGPLRHVAFGGGTLPESTEVSLEQDLTLAHQLLPGPGLLLFAGGEGSLSVRTEVRDADSPEPLLVRLGELFQPRVGRRSRYRESTLLAQAAQARAVEDELTRALDGEDDASLVVYVAAHGEQGEEPSQNAVLLWGNSILTPQRLAELHDDHPRPARFVITSCFSGGFAELAFAGADRTRGPARAPRCGLFAGTWDRETSGCDPDPDRRAQESYSLHFLHALAGEDRDGSRLPLDRLDLDGDGRVSLLEAHTRARIAARSIDVPTTTSERFVREAMLTVTGRAKALPPELTREDDAVIAQLSTELDVRDAPSARQRLDDLGERRATLEAEIGKAERVQDDAYWQLAALLLARWPVLDDAFHPEHAATLESEAAGIEAVLDRSPEAERYGEASRTLTALDARALELELADARLLRLVRAYETRELAAALYARGGTELRYYEELLACERDTLEGVRTSPP